MRFQSSTVSNFKPGQTWPRNTSRASSLGGRLHMNSVASTRAPGRHTRTSSRVARARSTNIVTASAMTASKESSGKGSERTSPSCTATRLSSPASRTAACARSSITGEMSTAVTLAPNRLATVIAVVATPQPTSRTLWFGEIAARFSSCSVARAPAGMDDPLANNRREDVGVEPLDLVWAEFPGLRDRRYVPHPLLVPLAP